MKKLQLIRGGASGADEPPGNGGENPVKIVFAPAKPVLDARIEMRKPLNWLDEQRRSDRWLFNPRRAAEMIETIPDEDRLVRAAGLFLEAEQQPAPEGWLHVAIGLMLQAQPYPADIDGDAYRSAIADGAFGDPEIWGVYEPGFSAAVIVNAIRFVQYELVTPKRFLGVCVKQRAQFKTWISDIGELKQIRRHAEDAIRNPEPLAITHDGDDDEDWEFDDSPIPPRPPGWQPPVDDDEDLPF